MMHSSGTLSCSAWLYEKRKLDRCKPNETKPPSLDSKLKERGNEDWQKEKVKRRD